MSTDVTPTASAREQPRRTIVIPSRPGRAPGVELLGELQGSGYAEQQWLIRRGTQFIQVTELLYRVAAHADGTRTLDEIAKAVTADTHWLVQREDVARLLATRLLPAGIISPSPGAQEDVAATPPNPSVLSVRAKRQIIGAKTIEPVAALLRHLFAPALLLPLLALVAYAHWWLYTERGLMAALVEALFIPGSPLILLGLVLLGTVVHEFGHAAALRYGGGHARGIGVGFYLIFPAFYTDATDGYRLSRWARVRTGLGGVYFHLLFALLLIAAALLFGLEFLLIAVLLVNIEVLRQFIPFVRLDGYWVLADLTGVPDFFSQMGPFLRSLSPRRSLRGTRLPRLKGWVRVSFGLYTIVAVPVLLALLLLLLDRLPTFATGIWDALRTQIRILGATEGDVLLVATSIAHALLLVLSAVAIAYFVYSLTWKPARAAWRSPAPTRRFVGLAAIAALFAAAGALWAPELPFAQDAKPLGVQTFHVAGRAHVSGPVTYPQAPPVGGDHAPVWQNCGFYPEPVRSENAVHSLEHGAVWIAYAPNLTRDEVSVLRAFARRQSHVLASPFPGLRQPVVAVAWARRLPLQSVHDVRLERFVDAYRLSADAPEAGGPCNGGKGRPR